MLNYQMTRDMIFFKKMTEEDYWHCILDQVIRSGTDITLNTHTEQL